jgi:hypothetical protein
MSQIDRTSMRFTFSYRERTLATNQIWIDDACILLSMYTSFQALWGQIQFYLDVVRVTTVVRICQTEIKISLCHNNMVFLRAISVES